MRKGSSARGSSNRSLRDLPEIHFASYRMRRNPFAKRIAKEGIEIVAGRTTLDPCPKQDRQRRRYATFRRSISARRGRGATPTLSGSHRRGSRCRSVVEGPTRRRGWSYGPEVHSAAREGLEASRAARQRRGHPASRGPSGCCSRLAQSSGQERGWGGSSLILFEASGAERLTPILASTLALE